MSSPANSGPLDVENLNDTDVSDFYTRINPVGTATGRPTNVITTPEIIGSGATITVTGIAADVGGDNLDAKVLGGTPGYGHDSITEFRPGGQGHDTIELPSSDFTSFADVLRHTQNTAAGAVIHDPKSGDTLTIAGLSKAQMSYYRSDFTFHA